MGLAIIGTGVAEGRGPRDEAANRAISARCSTPSVRGAHGVIVDVTGGTDISLLEVE